MKTVRILKELYIGIALCGLVFLLVGIIFVRPAWMYALGIVVGCISACLQSYHMYDTLDRALDRRSDKAKSFVTVRSFFRLAFCLILMAVALMIHWSAFVGVAIGLMCLKFSAFLNPIITKLLGHRDK